MTTSTTLTTSLASLTVAELREIAAKMLDDPMGGADTMLHAALTALEAKLDPAEFDLLCDKLA